jgi:hypothetical protein
MSNNTNLDNMYISNIKPQYCATMVHEMHVQHTEYGQVWWFSLLFVSCEVSGKTANQSMKTNR